MFYGTRDPKEEQNHEDYTILSPAWLILDLKANFLGKP